MTHQVMAMHPLHFYMDPPLSSREIKMGIGHESEWNAAQSITLSKDLVSAAKHHLQFLATVDRNRWLYQTQTLQQAIYRYNACWLPLLAKHCNSPVTKGPLVVPLDCEWVWHCHKLNPVRYQSDCEQFYGKILGNCNVASSIQEISKTETEQIWNTLYPNEPYNIDLSIRNESKSPENGTKYDLVSAIERQIPFSYQVSRPHMNNDRFLETAVARYKGFLHLIKRNKERSVRSFCVPTYDIDLIWHTHQLNPVSYCNDLIELLGKVLEHDDTDQNRTKGQKLDVGFSETIKQWENLFGLRYWKAGSMYRGYTPTPVTTVPCIPKNVLKKVESDDRFQKLIDLPESNVVEVVLECVEIKNLPENKKVSVLFSKAQPDGIFNVKKKLNIQSESGKKQVATFRCKPTGDVLFELVSDSSTETAPLSKSEKILGHCSISLEDLVVNLSVEKWLDLVPSFGTVSCQPIRLRVAASCTVPIPAPCVLKMGHSPVSLKSVTQVTDESGNEIIGLQMREKKVISVTKEGEAVVVGEFVGSEWSLMDSLWSLKVENNSGIDAHLLLTGPQMVKLFHGRKLEYEMKHHERSTFEDYFMTAVEFSAEYPYGRAVALLDVKSGSLMLQEAWFASPGVLLAFIVFNSLRKEGNDGEFFDKKIEFDAQVYKDKLASGSCGAGLGGGCGAGLGGGCGNMVNSGGCVGAFGGGCGNMVKSGGCGAGLGGGCGNMVNSGGCGAGLGGGCGNMVKSGGCVGAFGGGCGNMVNSGGCGAGLGGGCGNIVSSGGCGNMVNGGGCGGGLGGGCGNMVESGGCGNMVVESGGIDEEPMQVAAYA